MHSKGCTLANAKGLKRNAEGFWAIVVGVHAVVVADGNAGAEAVDAIGEEQVVAVREEFRMGDHAVEKGDVSLERVVDGIDALREREGAGEVKTCRRIDRPTAVAV